MARNVSLYYSPDELIWYYQRWPDGKVSVKEYETKEDALQDYAKTDNPEYEWE